MICLSFDDKPRVLPCGHILCHTCLLRLLKSPTARNQCPSCTRKLSGLAATVPCVDLVHAWDVLARTSNSSLMDLVRVSIHGFPIPLHASEWFELERLWHAAPRQVVLALRIPMLLNKFGEDVAHVGLAAASAMLCDDALASRILAMTDLPTRLAFHRVIDRLQLTTDLLQLAALLRPMPSGAPLRRQFAAARNLRRATTPSLPNLNLHELAASHTRSSAPDPSDRSSNGPTVASSGSTIGLLPFRSRMHM